MRKKHFEFTPFSLFREVFSKTFSREDRGKSCLYSTWKALLKGVLGGLPGFSGIRDHLPPNNLAPISLSQFGARIRRISAGLLRQALLAYFKALKRREHFGKCVLIADKTFIPSPRRIERGKWCHVKRKEKTSKEWGVEYSFVLAYFPDAGQGFLLDWEEIPKGTGEAKAGKRAMERVAGKLISHRVRVCLILGDRLHCSHYWLGPWSREAAEGFLAIPRKDMLVGKNGKGLLDGIEYLEKPDFHGGKIKHGEKTFQLYGISNIHWADCGDFRKYLTREEQSAAGTSKWLSNPPLGKEKNGKTIVWDKCMVVCGTEDKHSREEKGVNSLK